MGVGVGEYKRKARVLRVARSGQRKLMRMVHAQQSHSAVIYFAYAPGGAHKKDGWSVIPRFCRRHNWHGAASLVGAGAQGGAAGRELSAQTKTITAYRASRMNLFRGEGSVVIQQVLCEEMGTL